MRDGGSENEAATDGDRDRINAEGPKDEDMGAFEPRRVAARHQSERGPS